MEGPIGWTEVCLYLLAGFVTLICIFFGGITLYLRNVYSKYAHIPQPPRSSFFTGHLFDLRKRLQNGKVLIGEVILQYVKEVGHTFALVIMGNVLFVTLDEDAIKEIFATGNFPKPKREYDAFRNLYGQRFVGKGLVTEIDNQVWQAKRQHINPAFYRQQLKMFMNEFNESGNELMKKLAECADGKTVVTMMEYLNRVTLDVIGKVAFSMDIDSLNDSTTPFPNAIFTSFRGFSRRIKTVVTHVIPFIDREFKQEVCKAIQVLRKSAAELIQQRNDELAKGNPVPQDVLSFVIDAAAKNPGMNNEEIIDDFVTLFVAGQETTANKLGFTIREIGRHPNIFKKMQEEVESVLGDRQDMTFDDVNKLEYMGMVLKESLRLYPPVQAIFRMAPKDVKLAGYNVPKGTSVMVSHYTMSRLEEFHPDPMKFNPDRFKLDSDIKPSPYAYLPFALGPRNCIGMTFAQIEAKVILAKFLQRFTYKLDPNQSMDIEENATLRPRDGTRIVLSHRDS